MTLAPGTRLGVYEVVGALGAGGMGEVYRARDLQLKRDVALKVLPEHFTADPDRLARFQREAEVLASLNHPHIAQIHGLEESGALRALVMELVEGETLSEWIGRRHPSAVGRALSGPPLKALSGPPVKALSGPPASPHPIGSGLHVDEALAIARQICEALEAAHEQGIIHRDLKPANIKLRPDGTVKVLDFGLAKLVSPAEAGHHDSINASRSPTVTIPAMTQLGVILGTAAYMSPEQAKGKVADKRSDVWAFGAVLYEMLTGTRAFRGDELSDTLALVITQEPDWAALPANTPAAIRKLLRRCLEKDRKRRLADIADARLEIDDAQSHSQTEDRREADTPRRKERVSWLSALVLVSLIAVVATVLARRPVPPASEMRVEITTPPTTDLVSLAISPDGRKIVFIATSEGRPRLWLRSLDSGLARPLAGTDGASLPFWSPDSGSVGFFADSKLKRIDIEGRTVQTLAGAAAGRGGAWNRAGTILFAASLSTPLFRISATGGEPTALTRLDGLQFGHSSPQFLPDGRHFLFYVRGGLDAQGVYVGQLEGAEPRRLLDADSTAVYASSRHLLFVRQGTLFGQSFDPDRLELAGNPFPVAEGITVEVGGGAVALSASNGGPIVYRSGTAGVRRQLAWFDRSGKEIQQVGVPENAERLQNPSLSLDGRLVTLYRRIDGNADVWLLEVGRGVFSRLTFDAADDVFPTWSPDGVRIVFSSNRKTRVHDLYQTSTAGVGKEDLLLGTPQYKHSTDWSPDGRFVLYRSQDPKMGFNIWAVPVDGDRKPFAVVQTEFDERDGQFSPDGKWIAYQSNESGRVEIYVQPFPGPGGKSTISTNGGAQVRWRRDGKELFYIALDGRLMAVPIRLGQSVEAGKPVPLFDTHVGGAVQTNLRQQYMLSPDGQRFLMNIFPDEALASPITVILNWAGTPKK